MFWTDVISDDCTGCKWVNYSDGGGWYMRSRSKKCPVHGSKQEDWAMSSVEISTASGVVIRSTAGELWHDAAVPGHIREAATVGEFLDVPRPGVILADCSCGAEYEVPQGGDEYGALEKAHREHVAAAEGAR